MSVYALLFISHKTLRIVVSIIYNLRDFKIRQNATYSRTYIVINVIIMYLEKTVASQQCLLHQSWVCRNILRNFRTKVLPFVTTVDSSILFCLLITIGNSNTADTSDCKVETLMTAFDLQHKSDIYIYIYIFMHVLCTFKYCNNF